ncbi:MAG: MerR family transcriptional regulator [Chlorobium sp.]|uniref:MerR family transcriptional regulator n=1 Tax=Chlorobium sp. TaxID=1095 RepID=UPI0025BC8424|nr:MerR family transcriptional regulator [Chlorobium sp.]MCF8382660.1 MerR family transcriptional regulator [Chlorobium sp.]
MPFETQKSYYSIGEVSRIAGVPAYLLRYWESFFTELTPSRDTRGNRRYTNRDIAMVLNIKELVYDKGYKLGRASELVKGDAPENDSDRKTAEILKLRKQIERDQKKNSTVDDRRRVLLEEIREEVEDLLQMLG